MSNSIISRQGKKLQVIIFCDVNSMGGVFFYSQKLMESACRAGILLHLISHKPSSIKAQENLETLLPLTHSHVLIDNGLHEDDILDEIKIFLKRTPAEWYIPNYRDAPHGAILEAKRCGLRTIFVSHNDHGSYYRYALRYQDNIDLFIAPSKKITQYLLSVLSEVNKSRVRYVAHAVSYMPQGESLSKPVPHRPIRLLYHGRLEQDQKNVLELARVSLALQQRLVAHEFHIAGEGPAGQALRSEFEKFQNNPAIFYGHLSRGKLVRLFSSCDVAVLTSFYEGFCLSLAEAMRHGLPAVAYECGGVINDYLVDGRNGFLVPHGDHERMADRIALLANRRETFASFSRFAINKLAEEFSDEQFTNHYIALLTALNEKPLPLSWPRLRPQLIPEVKSIKGVTELIGCRLLGWPRL